MMVVVIRFFDRGMAEGARIPWFVWVVIPVLVVSWALWSWLAGYDAEQWLWTATSMAVFSVGIVLAFFRR
jgi:Na+/melibiose symporter-like transporter